jgi:hypothetical protein
MEHVRWKKSSKSGGDNGQCVELALPTEGLLVRDSKNPDGPSLRFSGAALDGLLSAVKGGRLGA